MKAVNSLGLYIQDNYLMEDCNSCGDQVLLIDKTKIDMTNVNVKKPSVILCRDCYNKLRSMILQ